MSATREKAVSLPLVDCWNSIGVRGDQSCPKLAAVVHCHNCEVFAHAAQAFLDRPVPEGYLTEMTSLFAVSAEAGPAADRLSVVVFEIEGQTFAIDTAAVVEVTEPRGIHKMAHRSGRVFSGIVNIHGQLELCASLQGLLQIARDESREKSRFQDSRMLLVEHAEQRWVFGVDRTHGVRRFAPADVLGVPATTLHDAASYVKSILRWEERDVGCLDLDKTFGALGVTLR
jgi:chemotaxis-related protein WspD